MSLRYMIGNLQEMRDAAGLGTLSLGLYGNGDLVSSTPIPGSRMGGGQADPEYGGYLLGEGMTREAARYLGTLHNLFPDLAEALRRQVDEYSFDNAAYVKRLAAIAQKHGWSELDGPLADWIEQALDVLDAYRKAKEDQP
jgi:hypothetical protein